MRPKKKDEYSEIYSDSTNQDDEYEDNYEATRDLLGYDPPECPQCGTIMKVRFSDNNFKCPNCGYSVDEEDLEDELDSFDNFSDCYSGNGGNPKCENCGAEMEYSYQRHKFMCPICHETMEESDWELANEYDDYDDHYSSDIQDDEKPDVCETCDGPYPDCVDGCKLIK
ncbi:MAG: transposase [Clostridia bacterium]|nr:transposase [Clostridia bacterium]